jgi:predicted nucleic acid-binding Zn ribbon protein
MPTYRYQCLHCAQEEEFWQSIHDDPLRVHNMLPNGGSCSGALVKVLGPVRTVRVGSRGARTVEVDSTEARWSKDMTAYKTMRADGNQPLRIDGAHRMQSEAKGTFHLESGMPYTDAQVAESREAGRALARNIDQGVI